MRLLVIGLSVVLAVLAMMRPASAASDTVFVVPRVPVQAQADSATEAKTIAQNLGRRRAMDILLRRLTPESDWDYLPRLARGEEASIAEGPDGKRAIVITARDLEGIESGFEVYDEKTSSRTYRALITYRFKPTAVRQLLKSARIPYSEAQTRTALVLPVLQTDSGVYLWESNNPWMAAWKARPYTHELTPMIAPLGDLEDTLKITARAALDLNPEGLAAIAGHYRVSQVVVAHARLQRIDGEDRLRVRLLNAYRETASAADISDIEELGEDADEIDYGAAYGLNPIAAAESFGGSVGAVLADVALTEVSGNFPGLSERAIEGLIARYAKSWKEKTLIDHAAESILGATAFFEGIGDWSRIRSALISIPLVGGVQVSALSRRGAEMELRVFGDPRRLQIALENQGVTFWTETGERWFLATPSVAARFKGKRSLRVRQRGVYGEYEPLGDDPMQPIPTADGPSLAPESKIERRN